MPSYEILFAHDIDTDDQFLSVGDAFRWDGIIWQVSEAVSNRLVLRLWPNGIAYPAEIKGTD